MQGFQVLRFIGLRVQGLGFQGLGLNVIVTLINPPPSDLVLRFGLIAIENDGGLGRYEVVQIEYK